MFSGYWTSSGGSEGVGGTEGGRDDGREGSGDRLEPGFRWGDSMGEDTGVGFRWSRGIGVTVLRVGAGKGGWGVFGGKGSEGVGTLDGLVLEGGIGVPPNLLVER